MAGYFDSPRLKVAFTFQDVYMGFSPFEAASTFSMMPYSELAHGMWYPKGGMYCVVATLVEIARLAGVEFEYGTAVEKIMADWYEIKGVLLEDGRCLSADFIVANADLPYVYQKLLPQDREAKRLARNRFSCSKISFFWGIDKPVPSLPPHTLFLVDE
jgi:phytoene dehydrogenase-like protein